MTSLSLIAPGEDEYPAFYAGYIAEARAREAIALLHNQPTRLRAAVAGLSEAEANHRYASGKWSVKEVVGHLADAERVFGYRLLRVGRGDPTPLSGFDENAYVAAARFDDQPVAALLDHFAAARRSTSGVLETLGQKDLQNRGIASGSPITARALVHIIVGHVEHHLSILRDRYNLQVPAEIETRLPGL